MNNPDQAAAPQATISEMIERIYGSLNPAELELVTDTLNHWLKSKALLSHEPAGPNGHIMTITDTVRLFQLLHLSVFEARSSKGFRVEPRDQNVRTRPAEPRREEPTTEKTFAPRRDQPAPRQIVEVDQERLVREIERGR